MTSESRPAPMERIASIDALRGLTILVMIFVNDIAGVAGVPGWMKHYFPYDADGMTFVDVVFPAFLFIVGMAIPFAIGRRLDRGESPLRVWGHAAWRTLGLLVIGVLMVNGYSLGDEGLLPKEVWRFLLYVGLILAWNEVPREPGRRRNVLQGLRVAGIVLLGFLVVVYDGKDVEGAIQMRTHWWGIIGLIGWAYAVACLAYGFLRRNLAGLVGVMALLYLLYVADRTGLFGGMWVRNYLDLGSQIGGHGGIAVAGVALGVVLAPGSSITAPWHRIRWAVLFGAGLWLAGWMTHRLATVDPMFIVNKNMATPPWCLMCSAWAAWTWAVLYWLMDVRGWRRWAGFLQPAGENPLFAYVLHPLVNHGFALLALVTGTNYQYLLGRSFWPGFGRAVVTAVALSWVVGYLRTRGVRMRV